MKFNALNQGGFLKNYLMKQNVLRAILAQNVAKLVSNIQPKWILAVSCLPLFGIYAAFGISPQTIPQPISQSIVVDKITLPTQALSTEILKEPSVYTYKEYVRRDDTLNAILTRLNVRNPNAIQFVHANLLTDTTSKLLKPGQAFEAQVDDIGNLISLVYQYNSGESLKIEATSNQDFVTEKLLIQPELRPVLKSATIESSLFAATDKANIPDEIAIQIANILESEIDFHQDLRRHDHFNVIYQAHFKQGVPVKIGDVLAIEFVNNGKTYRAFGFHDREEKMQYYTPEGNSLHKSFLRSPLEFSRITSGFNLGRFHPILQHIRAHKGVDMAAPIGTKIKATGDAVVDFIGTKSGYGNVIVLKHNGGMSTVYGHLSRFASGLRRGDKINQGEVIGHVGMTGLATGPHLHYEFLLNGQHRDPMTVALPRAMPIDAAQKPAFFKHSQQLSAQLNLLNNTNIAALE